MSKPTGNRTIKRLEEALAHSKWEHERDVKRLEETIYSLRCNLIHTAPYEFYEIIRHANVLRDDLWRWEREAVAAIIEKAPVIPAATVYHKDRAACPLCRDLPGMEDGFAMPVGLERHLTGYGNMQQCPVMRAAMDLHKRRDQSSRNSAETRLETQLQEQLRSLKAKEKTP
jgi:hypothetical protein